MLMWRAPARLRVKAAAGAPCRWRGSAPAPAGPPTTTVAAPGRCSPRARRRAAPGRGSPRCAAARAPRRRRGPAAGRRPGAGGRWTTGPSPPRRSPARVTDGKSTSCGRSVSPCRTTHVELRPVTAPRCTLTRSPSWMWSSGTARAARERRPAPRLAQALGGDRPAALERAQPADVRDPAHADGAGPAAGPEAGDPAVTAASSKGTAVGSTTWIASAEPVQQELAHEAPVVRVEPLRRGDEGAAVPGRARAAVARKCTCRPASRLASRPWARAVSASHSFQPAGIWWWRT